MKENNFLKHYIGLTATLLIGIFLSILAFSMVLRSNLEQLEGNFLYESQLKMQNLYNGFNSYEWGMELIHIFFESSKEVTEKEFQSFVSPLIEETDFSNILWIPRTNGSVPTKAEFGVTKNGYTHFSDVEPSMEIVDYPDIYRLVADSIKTKLPLMKTNTQFVKGDLNNVAVGYPVIKSNKVEGVVIGLIDFPTMISELVASSVEYRNFYFYNQDDLLFSIQNGSIIFQKAGEDGVLSTEALKQQSAFFYEGLLPIFNQNWRVIVVPTAEYTNQATDWYAWLVLSLGILITIVFGVSLFQFISQNLQIKVAVSMATKKLEASKQQMEAIVNTVLEGIITIDEYGIVQTFNPAAESIFGYDRKEVIGENVSMLMSGENKRQHNQYIKNYLTTGVAKIIGIGREVEGRRKDGTFFPMGLGITQTSLNGNTIFVGAVRDMSVEKDAKEGLRKAIKEANQANQYKSEFLATMSHEIRTPMNGIIGMTELMLESDLPIRQRSRAEAIMTSANILMSIINDVLDFSKIESGKMELDLVDFDLRKTAEDIVRLFVPKAQEQGVELKFRYAPNVPSYVHADKVRLSQIITNFVSNALKFTQEGYVLVNIECLPRLEVDSRKHHIFVSVHDTGIGVPEDKKQAVFEKFSQADASTTRKYGGTGLGLAICKQLVKMMGGDIGVANNEDKGSIFWFVAELEAAKKVEEVECAHSLLLQGKNILLLDNHKTSSHILEEYLEKHKTYIDISHDIQQLYESNTMRVYDIVIMDYQLSHSASKFIRNLKQDKRYKNALFVLLSLYGSEEFLEKAEQDGFDACIIKPLYEDEVIGVLTLLLQRQEQKEENRNIVTNTHLSERDEVDASNILDFQGAKILVAEDNAVNQALAEERLISLGCEVDIAENGAAALQKIQQKQYDIVLMDCQMPVMDGYEATEAIMKLVNKGVIEPISVIAMTANAMRGDKEKCFAAGMKDYISKPVRRKILQHILIKWLPHTENKYMKDNEMQYRNNMLSLVGEHEKALVDAEEIIRVKHILGARFDEVIEGYLQDIEMYIEGIEYALEARDNEEIAKKAHPLKSASIGLGVTVLADIAEKIEEAAFNGESYAVITDDLRRLKEAKKQVVDILSKSTQMIYKENKA